MAIWNPRQIATQNIDSERGGHKDSAYPEAPVSMHPPPVRPWIGFASAVAVSFGVVPVSGHCFSLSDVHSQPRAPYCRMLDSTRLGWPTRRSSGDQSSPPPVTTIEGNTSGSPVNYGQNVCYTLFRNGVITSLLQPKAGPLLEHS